MYRTDVVVNEQELEAKVTEIFEGEGSKSSKMKKMFDLGLDVKVIAEIMDVRYNFVYNVISNYVNIEDIPVSRTAGESKKDAIIQLFLDGKSNKEIAKQLKLNYNYIYKVIREFGEQSAASAKALVDAVKEANGVPLDQPFPENMTKGAPPAPVPVSEMEIAKEITPEPEEVAMQEALQTVEEWKQEQATSADSAQTTTEAPEVTEIVRDKRPVEQSLWKGVKPETKSGIAAFFANRRKNT